MSYPTDPKFKKKDIHLDSIRWDNNAINITITAVTTELIYISN